MREFFAFFFEFFGTVKSAPSDDLYEYAYIPAGFMWLGFTLLWVILFYQGFIVWQRKARFDTKIHWGIWMLISSLLTTIFIWIFAHSRLQSEDLIYTLDEYLEFLCLVFLWCVVLYILFSVPLKYSNASRRKIPF